MKTIKQQDIVMNTMAHITFAMVKLTTLEEKNFGDEYLLDSAYKTSPM